MEEVRIDLIEDKPLRIMQNAEINDMIQSFTTQGQLSPIMIKRHESRERMYAVVYGNRRLSAARKLGWNTILAQVVDIDETDALKIAFSENIDRKDFSDYEKGLLLLKLRKVSGKTYEDIAKMIGKSVAYVSQHAAIPELFGGLEVPQDEKDKVLSALTERHARSLSRIENVSERWNTAKLSVTSGFCVRELDRIVRGPKRGNKKDSKLSIRKSIASLLDKIIDDINRKDLRSYFQSRSSHYYSLFDDFPPFYKMDRFQAAEQNCKLHRLYKLKLGIQDLDIRALGTSSAFTTMSVNYEVSLGEARSVNLYARATMIFVREKGWKIIHEHWSLPDSITDNNNSSNGPIQSSLFANLSRPLVPI